MASTTGPHTQKRFVLDEPTELETVAVKKTEITYVQIDVQIKIKNTTKKLVIPGVKKTSKLYALVNGRKTQKMKTSMKLT